MRGSHTTRSKVALAAALTSLLVLATSACTPTNLEVERNMARSFARKVDQAKDLRSNCSIIGSDSKKQSFLSECTVSGADGYYLIVRVGTDYQAGTFSVRDPYPRSAGGYLEQVDGTWTYRWAA
jgi:hypothetical protein